MNLKPQDLVTTLALVVLDKVPTYAALGETVGISASESHGAVRRLRKAALVDIDRRVNRSALLDFLFHGLRRAFPVVVEGPTLGVPTGAAAPCIDGLPDPEFAPWVWPSEQGTVRGLSLAPLYPSIPVSAPANEQLYELLVLADLLRAGNAREVSHAERRFRQLLGNKRQAALASALDVSSPRALQAIFSRQKVAYGIAKWSREPVSQAIVRHPLEKLILAEYKDDFADLLSSTVPNNTWGPSAGYHVVIEKSSGAARDLVHPSIIDTIVARRVIDELEPTIRHGDDNRVFVGSRHSSSRLPPGEYVQWWSEWSRYLESTAAAAEVDGMALVLLTDIEEFFPSISRTDARQVLAQCTGAHTSVIGLLFLCLEAWLPRFSYRPTGGLPLEPHGVSGLVAHCFLKQVDEVFDDGFDLRYRRYVDDTVMFVDDQSSATARLEQHRRELAALGLRPNASKTRILPTVEFRQERHEDVHKAIDEAKNSESAGPLDEITREWLKRCAEEKKSVKEPERDRTLGHDGVMRHLYTAHRQLGTSTLIERALQDAKKPHYRSNALRYLRRCTLDAAQSANLQNQYDESAYAGSRIELARTLAEAPLSRSVDHREFARWSSQRVRRQTKEQPGDGYARAILLLAVFKYGDESERTEIGSWATPSRLADPYLRMIFTYVFAAAGEFAHPLHAVLRHGGSEDFALLMRLCEDAESGNLRHLTRLLPACRSYQHRCHRYVVSAEVLPMLHILARAAAHSDDIATAMTDWLDSTLQPDLRPADVAICAHLLRLSRQVKV